MKVAFALLLSLAAAVCVAGSALDPLAALNAELPPPPRHHQAESTPSVHPSLLAVAASTKVNAKAQLEARLAEQMALAMDQSVVESASVDQHITALGQMNAEESALVNKLVHIPTLPDPAKPIRYTAPPTRDQLAASGVYPWPEKLDNALHTVVDATRSRISQIKREQKWSSDAEKLVTELGQKKHKVTDHVAKLTKEIKDLLGKKKQIQNKILQDKLVKRLEETHNNLRKVRRQTHHIRKNEAKMLHHKEELAHALEGIKRSLSLLKGLKRKPKYPTRGEAQKKLDNLGLSDPDISAEAEADADSVRQAMFPDQALLGESEQIEDMDDIHAHQP